MARVAKLLEHLEERIEPDLASIASGRKLGARGSQCGD